MTDSDLAPGATGCWATACDATLQAVVESAGCPELFRRSLTGFVSWQVRNRTTIERALNTPSAALAWFAALLALGAEVSVEGQANLPVDLFLERRVKGRLRVLHVPTLGRDGSPLRGILWGEARVARTPSDEPIVAAVAVVQEGPDAVTSARLALTGVWARPVALANAASLLVGARLSPARIQQVAAKVGAEVAPKGDFLGSVEYRRAMGSVMARRALEECLAGRRAEQSEGETGDERQA